MKKADPVLDRIHAGIEDHAVQVSVATHNAFARATRNVHTRHNQWADQLEAERKERRLRALDRFTIDYAKARLDPEYAKRKNAELDALLRAAREANPTHTAS